jgi:hypothetical protein
MEKAGVVGQPDPGFSHPYLSQKSLFLLTYLKG